MTTETQTPATPITAARRMSAATRKSDAITRGLNKALEETAAAERAVNVTNPATAQLAGVTADPTTTPKRPPRPKSSAKTPAKKPAAAAKSERSEPANPKGATVDILLAAFADALKTQDAASVRKLVLAAQRRATDPKFVPNSSPSQRSKHSAVKLAGELTALSAEN
jgi:hypothetical protein